MTTLEFDKKVKCGSEFVALRIIENNEELKIGNISLPSMTDANNRLAFCIVEDIGEKAASEYGVKNGDYVLIDRLSTFAHTAPVCMCRYNNIICLTDQTCSVVRPLRNMLFVEQQNHNEVLNINGIYVPGSYDEKLNTGTITAVNFDEDLHSIFKVGDEVILVKGGDYVEFGQHKIYIYKHDMIVCRIEK